MPQICSETVICFQRQQIHNKISDSSLIIYHCNLGYSLENRPGSVYTELPVADSVHLYSEAWESSIWIPTAQKGDCPENIIFGLDPFTGPFQGIPEQQLPGIHIIPFITTASCCVG